jgi:ketosteroid isomerase-like protein
MTHEHANFDRRRFLGAGGAGLAGLALVQPARADGRSLRKANLRIVHGYYAAYAANDLAALAERYFAPDIAWTIPGHHPLAGTKRGIDEVLAFFEQLASAGFRATPLFLEANDEWVVDLHRGWNTVGEPRIDMTWALAFRIRDGRIAEAVNYPGDQHEADRFFWARYPLAPLPDRLAG